MATNDQAHPTPAAAPTPGAAPTATAAAHLDELTGVYGFFRRHQKKLLYTAGLFTLLTFSVTGPMLGVVESLFREKLPMPTIVVGGRRIELEPEDYQIAEQMSRNAFALSPLLPPLGPQDGGDSDLPDVLAILRRAAIAEGIDASMVEVDRAIKTQMEQTKLTSEAQLAAQRRMNSLAQYRELLREAMRIGVYVRLQTLALDSSDAHVLRKVIADKEKIALRVASFDEKAAEEQLKAGATMTDDDLRKWLDGKAEADKRRIGVYDTNRVELRFGIAMREQFVADEWKEDALKDFTIGDEQLKRYYEQDKEQRFKLEGDKQYKPFDDAAVKAELTAVVQMEQVMNSLLGKLRAQVEETLKPLNEEVRRTSDAYVKAQNDVEAAKTKIKSLETSTDQKAKDDAAEELRKAEVEVLPAMKNAFDAAQEAVKTARAAFDAGAAFAEMTKGKSGFSVKHLPGKKNAEELKDLDQGDLGLGQWQQSVMATYLQNKGDLAQGAGRTTKAAFLWQVTDIDVQPLKPWDKLKTILEGAYYTEQARKQAEEKKRALEDALLAMAKAKIPEQVAQIEGKRQGEIGAKFGAWEKTTQDEIASCEKRLAEIAPGTRAHEAYSAQLANLKGQLEKRDEKKQQIESEVDKALTDEVAAEAKKHYHEVMEAAAQQVGFTVTKTLPYSRELAQTPRFDKIYDPATVYLFRNHAQLKKHEATAVVEDRTNRRWLMAACIEVEPLTADDVTRRQFDQLRAGFGSWSFADVQALRAYEQAFTREALEARYEFQSASGVQRQAEPPKDSPSPPKDPPK